MTLPAFRFPVCLAVLACALTIVCTAAAEEPVDPSSEQAIGVLFQLLSGERELEQEAFEFIERQWQPSFAPMLLELVYLSRDPYTRSRLMGQIAKRTGQKHGDDFDAWYKWLWAREPMDHPHYGDFKSAIYSLIDPKFRAYFASERTSKIRLDEVRWGGVRQDGIPRYAIPR